MKKTTIILSIALFSLLSCAFALDKGEILIQKEEQKLADTKTTQKAEENFEQPVLLEPEEQQKEEKTLTLEEEKKFKSVLQGIIEKDYDINSADGMFKGQLTQHFERGPIKENTIQLSNLMNWTEKIDNNSNFDYDYNTINLGLKGKFRSEKESYNLLFNLTPNVHQNFWHRFVLDAWVQTKRIPHHTITFGTYRPTVGYEGAQSAFTVPFIARTQIARNFGNIRKTGLKINGSYKYMDYYLEGYSSDTWYSEFFPGVEGIAWADFKPLANTDGRYGTLKMGGGIQGGRRNNVDYTVTSAALKYDYKKFGLLSEFAWADGSNGASGLTDKKRWGYNVTLTYMLTKKLQMLLRYDDFDSNKKIAHNNSREYTAGLNYFILGQTLRVVLNYIYCQNDGKHDSHKIVVGTQFLL